MKSLPFHIPEAWKGYPFRAEPPRIGHYREYPHPGTCVHEIPKGKKAKGDVKREAYSTAQSITSALSTQDANRILEQIKINAQRVFDYTKDKQKQKFEKLTHKKQAALSPPDTPSTDKTNWVINLSSGSLSDAEIALLKIITASPLPFTASQPKQKHLLAKSR